MNSYVGFTPLPEVVESHSGVVVGEYHCGLDVAEEVEFPAEEFLKNEKD